MRASKQRPGRFAVRSVLLTAAACVHSTLCIERCATAADALPQVPAAKFAQPDPQRHPDLFTWSDTCNTVVLRSGDAALLFDLGDGSVLGALNEIGVKRVEWVLFTHHHREQCQGIDRVDRKTTQVAVPAAERDLFERPTEFRKWFPQLDDMYTVYGASYVRPPRTAIVPDRLLAGDDVFRWKGHEIRCLETPGHSPGSLSYVLRLDGRTVAVTGGVMHDGAKLTTWFDTEWDYGFAKGIDVLSGSVARLAERKIDLALPSHGPPIRDAQAQFESYGRRLKTLRASYVRGYNVFDAKPEERDPLSKPTPMPWLAEVTPHLFKLGPKTPGKNFAIIVSDNGRGLILDAGLFPETMLDEIVLGLRQHKGLKQIDAFWISHMHGDHFLLGPALRSRYGAKSWTLDRIVDPCEHPRRYDFAALVSSYKDGFDGMKIDKAFRDGETVRWEGYDIHVDWMPGQTEYGCCLWLMLDGKKIAFTGDNLFGSPADPKQNGHEAVVARNSAILEEGYVRGSRYLKELAPDIVMGSHSYVMPEPAAFLDRYHAWSKEMAALFRDMLPDPDYEYLFDPYWVSAYPYRVDLRTADTQQVSVTVRNFRDKPQQHRIELKLPPGVSASPAILDGTVPAKSRSKFPVTLTVDRRTVPQGVQTTTFDITLDGRRHGELFDFPVLVRE